MLLLIIVSCQTANGFLLDDQCAIQPHCSCNNDSIRCDYSFRRLTQVPAFNVRSIHVKKIEIDLDANELSVIPSHAFSDLSAINATKVELRLYDNRINQIDMDAFSGIEDELTVLILTANNLSHVPKALASLHALTYLDLNRNPLINLDSMVMSKLGGSLSTLEFSLGKFDNFPHELQYLKSLQLLTMNDIPFTSLPIDAFRPFESNLTWLEINHSQLETVPAAFCNLPKLIWFEFNFNKKLRVNGTSLFDNCHLNVPSDLRILSLKDNNLSSLPNLTVLFPDLSKLVLEDNELDQLNPSALPGNLTNLALKDNLFKAIPRAINKLTALRELYLTGNNVTAINDLDLKGLVNLENLDLDRTLVSFVSPNAFTHNSKLVSVNLYHTKLDRIPESVLTLPNLRYLTLPSYQINCTCNEMSYLRGWNASSVYIQGTCRPYSYPFTKLSQFIKHDLDQCP